MSARTALIHVRLTRDPQRRGDGTRLEGPIMGGDVDGAALLPPNLQIADLEGACPGTEGFARVALGTRSDLADARPGSS